MVVHLSGSSMPTAWTSRTWEKHGHRVLRACGQGSKVVRAATGGRRTGAGPGDRRPNSRVNLAVADAPGCAKVTRNRGQFLREQAALRVLYLTVRDFDDYRGPSVGTRSSGWKQAV